MVKIKNHSLESLLDKKEKGKICNLPPINYIDDYSLKSVGKIQKMLIHLWKEKSLGMQIMLTLMFIWNLGTLYKINNDIQQDLAYNIGDVFLCILIFLIILYIIILSAKINSYF